MLDGIYYKKDLGIPYTMLILGLIGIILSVLTFFNNSVYEIYASYGMPIYGWQHFTANFGYDVESEGFIWVHYLSNMFMICLNGILIERLLGTKKIVVLTLGALAVAWINSSNIGRQTIDVGAGLLGIGWAYLPVGFYIWLKCVKAEKSKIFGNVNFYLMGFSFLTGLGCIIILSFWDAINTRYLMATIVGFVFLMAYKKTLKEQIEKSTIEEAHSLTSKTQKEKRLILLTTLLPIGMLFILGAYQLRLINPFLEGRVQFGYSKDAVLQKYRGVYSINYEDLKQQDGRIEIVFDEPIREISSLLASVDREEKIQAEIQYSKDRKIIYLNVANYEILNGHKGIIRLDKIYSESSKRVRAIKFVME